MTIIVSMLPDIRYFFEISAIFSDFSIPAFISCSYILFYVYLHELFYVCLCPVVGFSFPFISVYLYVAFLI